MKEYKIGNHILLRLENGKTNIYIENKKFLQCKYLLINNIVNNNRIIESIDDAASLLNNKLHDFQIKAYKISPEQEFIGHCSNLEVWHENDYDSRLLHSNLAIPLLKKLKELGDKRAQIVFKNEIIDRYINGNDDTRHFLEKEGYLDDFSEHELINLIIPNEQIIAFNQLKRKCKILTLKLKNKKFSKIDILLTNNKTSLYELAIIGKNLKSIIINSSFLNEIPKTIFNLKNLEHLEVNFKFLKKIPPSVKNLKRLKILSIPNNDLIDIPEEIGILTDLRELYLQNNKLSHLPRRIRDLRNLRVINISNNKFETIPECLKNLKRLKLINLAGNSFATIPQWLKKKKIKLRT